MAENTTINITINGKADAEVIAKEISKHLEGYRRIELSGKGVTIIGGKISVDVPETEYRKVSGREPKVGDFALVTYTEDDDLTVGKYYEILNIDGEGDFNIIDDTDSHSYIMKGEERFEVYEKASVEEAEPRLEVGDYAKVVNDSETNLFEVGDIVKITKVDYDKYDYEAESIIDENYDQFFERELVKATEEEVAEAKRPIEEEKRQQAERERWSAIGRKPNKYKEGDIVKVLSSFFAKNPGEIFEIARVDSDGNVFDENGYVYDTSKSRVKLITPVEARFDRA